MPSPDVHEFVPYTNGRFPNSCLRCGRTKEWHERMLAQLQEEATTETGDTDGG